MDEWEDLYQNNIHNTAICQIKTGYLNEHRMLLFFQCHPQFVSDVFTSRQKVRCMSLKPEEEDLVPLYLLNRVSVIDNAEAKRKDGDIERDRE